MNKSLYLNTSPVYGFLGYLGSAYPSHWLNIAVSIDNGVMHMMSLANIPMIVLFGPTNSKKFAPKNKFTKVLDSKIIHNTKDINSIDVDEVLSLI